MSYVSSDSILVYPSASRGQQAEYIDARITTETVVANTINKLIDTDGFIITDLESWNAETGVHSSVEFNLFGYFFTLRNPDALLETFSTSNAIYAVIALHPVATHETGVYRYELFGQDDSTLGVYQGIQFNSSSAYENPEILPDQYKIVSLKIFDKVNNSWELSEDTTFKFYKKSLLFDVDGGEITA